MEITSGILLVFFILRMVFAFFIFKTMQFLSRFLPREVRKVTLSQGTIIGLQQKTRFSKKIYFGFLGVPYAKPPINDLRFKPPVKHPGWSGVLKAFSEGNKSMQYPLMFNTFECSEDCLYLNIFVPQEENNEKMAVMVFIHGGAFICGSSSTFEYCPEYLLDDNVIVVTFNYRLNVFGFLNFDIDECPGNMGLKDQRFAIKWVKENISAFGGDADNITIFGLSAGSASVHCHTLSPQTVGLFQKAIMQSGNMFDSWAINEKHKEAAFRLAKNLGCEKDDPKDIVQYLKTVPAIDLLKQSNLEDKMDYLEYPFIPSIECDAISNPFLPAHPEVLKKTASPVPIISGLSDMEGIIILGGALFDPKMKKLDFRITEAMNTFFNGKYSEENVAKIKKFYFHSSDLECEKTRLENIVHLLSDVYFVKGFHRSFEHLLNHNITPVYNYEFKYDGKNNGIKIVSLFTQPSISKSLKDMKFPQSSCIDLPLKNIRLMFIGACHGDEVNYLFYIPLLGFSPKPNSPELQMCRTMSKLWTNFAKTGSPNSPDLSFEWKNTSVDNPKYLSIDGYNTKMVDGLLNGSRVNLWEDISKTVGTR